MTTASTASPGLIFSPGPTDHWDDARVSCPCVLREPDGRWQMWYYGRDAGFEPEIPLPTGYCGLARSDDGLHWTRVPGPLDNGAVLGPHPSKQRFDAAHVGCCHVARRDGLYWMWYIGGDHQRGRLGEFDVKGMELRPGCAISGDGLHWLRIEGPHGGAMLDLGRPGEPDMAMIGWPQPVQLPDGRWRLYYHALDPTRMLFVVCLAESADGLHWHKRGEVLGAGEPGAFDDLGIGTRYLMYHGGRWRMFYEGVGTNGHHSIGLAESDDGIVWTRRPGPEPDGSVFAHAPSGSGRWDAFAVGAPWVVPMPDDSLRLYYVGADETAGGIADELVKVQQIGLAVSDGPDPTRWARWTG
ncbi:glycosyl hydrolase [uncultured Thiohalocapsa sp.]|uniref:glycosyl hydrolase n=1 Tax=uncultured Thiohalocapsa sp. TaxID=768990 RepID=UPI0025D553D4|nr:glycosyl hydrolase [uncultured Thiohalocapsa sp.]